MKILNIFKHIKLVTKHKWIVFKLCCKIGIPWRGLVHDLSKFSPEEFFESVKYYNGTYSPILACKKEKGYSKAWLHHKGINKHHPEYWIDWSLPERSIIMPYKYAAEMVCDKLSAGITYNGKKWTKDTQINYYLKERQHSIINPHIDEFLLAVFTQVSINGIEKTLTKQNIKEQYERYCIRWEKFDENKIQTMGKTGTRSK